MNNLDEEIAYWTERLENLQRQKAKLKKPKPEKPIRPRGRPRMDADIIAKAKELGRNMPLPMVALKLDVSMATLYRYQIKRKILNAEKNSISKCDLSAAASAGTITD